MTIEILYPGSRAQWLDLRKETIGASMAAATLGIHPYATPLELWAIMTGRLTKEFAATKMEANSIILPPTERGTFLEDKAIELARMLRPEWNITSNAIPGGLYFRDLSAHMSATPDAFINSPARGKGALQIKSVARPVFKREWLQEDHRIEPPLWIVVQAMIDAHLSGCDWAAVGVMICDFTVDFHLIDIPMRADVLDHIRDTIGDFWSEYIATDTMPDPDYARDGAVLAKLIVDREGTSIDLRGDNEVPGLCEEDKELLARSNLIDARREFIKTAIRHKLNGASYGLHPDWKITNKVQTRKEHVVTESSVPVLRITRKS